MADNAPPQTWPATLRAAAEVLNSYADRAEVHWNARAGWNPDAWLTWAHRGAVSLVEGRAREVAAEQEEMARRRAVWDRQDAEPTAGPTQRQTS
ncbi:hypothetical protein [Labedaea rhizosphaerae]|uniref:Uncharacterized protein n=1 Tax=Labedaea rhizosphaerae TaxID=598644 RepID=A0A4R6SD52_LABRH|nr:hypothetical protein [Labedaea rhizosphaerae]TDP97634.1 hypothetical protein EV186_103598 [Labedaea rhizosphaerae]